MNLAANAPYEQDARGELPLTPFVSRKHCEQLPQIYFLLSHKPPQYDHFSLNDLWTTVLHDADRALKNLL